MRQSVKREHWGTRLACSLESRPRTAYLRILESTRLWPVAKASRPQTSCSFVVGLTRIAPWFCEGQVGVIGDPTFQGQGYDLSGFRVLVDYLIGFYGGQHIAILYEASHYPTYEPMIQPVALADLADAKATAVTTLYVPPKGVTVLDSEMLKLLRLDPGVIHKVAITLGNKLADPPRSANSMATGEKPAFDVAKVLSGPKSTKKQKKVASSDLAQRKLKNKRTDNG